MQSESNSPKLRGRCPVIRRSPNDTYTSRVRWGQRRPEGGFGTAAPMDGDPHPPRRFLIKIADMRFVYLSPHLDDAVLSAGGLIHDQVRQGLKVEVWTVMSGFPGRQQLSPFALEMHTQWGTGTPNETVRLRRGEDGRATGRLGARRVHFGFFDCIYRKDAQGLPLYADAMYVPVHSCDADLPARIAEALRPRLRPDDRLVCQLAIGEHVDHRLVRSAAELLGRPLLYVADIPYLFNHPDELAPHTQAMVASMQPVTADGFSAWIAAVEEYRSQMSTLFESFEALREAMRLYWSEGGGIRFWSNEHVPPEGA